MFTTCVTDTLLHRSFVASVGGASNDADDNAKDAKGTAENFHNENFHEQFRAHGVRKCATGSSHTHANSGTQVGKTGRQASEEDDVGRVESIRNVCLSLPTPAKEHKHQPRHNPERRVRVQ